MASKKFKGKICVYCGSSSQLSEAPDHVFAREFFIPGTPYEPIKVPACNKCNNEKSRFEHYLTALLPFGGLHRDALENLETMIPKRLAKNAKIHQALLNYSTTTWLKGDNAICATGALPIDFDYIDQLFKYIVKGLAWHHWGILFKGEYFIDILALSKSGEELFNQKAFNGNIGKCVDNDLGDGTFMYKGVQEIDSSSIKTAWIFSIYGGLRLKGDPRFPDEEISTIGAISKSQRQVFNDQCASSS